MNCDKINPACNFPRFQCVIVMGFLLLGLVAGCGGEDPNDGTNPDGSSMIACEDSMDCDTGDNGDGSCDNLAGTWEVTEHIYPSCQFIPSHTRNLTYPVTQDGCKVTIYNFGGIFTKTLNNHSISLAGSYPENGGTTSGTTTLTFKGDSLEGSSTWTWTDGVLDCSGTSQLIGTRSDPTIGPGCEDVSGLWQTSETVESQECDATGTSDMVYPVTQNGCDIKVNTPIGAFDGTVTDNQISWSSSFPDHGGITETESVFTITNNEISGLATWIWTGASTCSGTTQVTGIRNDGLGE